MEGQQGEAPAGVPSDNGAVAQQAAAAPQPPAAMGNAAPVAPPTAAVAATLPGAPAQPVVGATGGVSYGYEPKPRPVQKTAAQKEALEAAFQINAYPGEEMRRVLAEKTGLTEAQVNTWYSHRRRRDRKEGGTLTSPGQNAAGGGGAGVTPNGNTPGSFPPGGSGNRMSIDPASGGPAGNETEEEVEDDPMQLQRKAEYLEIVAAAQGALPQPFRDDGPPLGLEFDDIPSAVGAAGGGKGPGKRRRVGDDDPDFEMGSKRVRGGGSGSRPRSAVLGPGDLERLQAEEELRASLLADRARTQMERLENSIQREQERLAREKEKADTRMARERERELARLEGERRRHLEKVLREQKKEEERRAREAARLRVMQEKEERRLAAVREREVKAEEKKREKEERRKEREMMKAMSQHERSAMRQRTREPLAGPKDDLDFEWEALTAAYRAQHNVHDDVRLPAAEGEEAPVGLPAPLPERPPFPPPAVKLLPAAPAEVGDACAGGVLSAWSTLSAFSGMLGAEAPTVDELLAALAGGTRSALLADLHIGLLRLLQADAEEAHAAGEGGAGDARGGSHDGGKPRAATAPGAHLLEEAWAWGFDVDAWRAHLNRLTWPEVARELAIAAGLGRRRAQPKREERPRMGMEGEDIVVGGAQQQLELRLPGRLAVGTVKGAAWIVLKEAGYEGLHVEEIARRMQQRGLRDLRTSKMEAGGQFPPGVRASIAGALARDVLFERIAPATFALQSLRAQHARLHVAAGGGTPEGAADGGVKKEREDGEGGAEVKGEVEEEAEYDTDEDRAEEERRQMDEAHAGEPWVAALFHSDYDTLPLDQRTAMLCALCQLALDGPTMRNALERRHEEQQRIKRAMFEESKAEATAQRQRRQVEAVSKARAQAEEAQRHLEQLRAMHGLVPAAGPNDDAAALTAVLAAVNSEQQASGQGGGVVPMQVDAAPPAQPQQPAAAAANAHSAAEMAILAAEGPQSAEEREAARARAAARAEASLKEMEASAVRTESLGADRRHNRYWRFALGTEAPVTPAPAGRLFVEAGEDGALRVLCTVQDLDALTAALDKRGPREGALYASLVRYRDDLVRGMPSVPLALPAAPPPPPTPQELDAAACTSAAAALAAAHVPAGKKRKAAAVAAAEPAETCGGAPEVAKVKGDMAAVQAALPGDSLEAEFDDAAWEGRLNGAATPAELRRSLGELEAAISPAHLHPDYRKEPLLVKGAWIQVGKEVASALPIGAAADFLLPDSPAGGAANGSSDKGADGGAAAAEPLGWLPPTLGAVALRLYALDAALKYREGQAARDGLEGYRFILRPARLPGKPAGLLRGMPLDRQGRIRPTLFPPFPHRLLFAPRGDFSFNVLQFETDVATGSDALVGTSGAAARVGKAGGGANGRRGRPKGSKNKLQKPKLVGLPGHWGPRGGFADRSGPVHRNAMEMDAQRSDSEKHYGSDFDNGEEEEDDEDDFLPVSSAPAPLQQKQQSSNPSAPPSTIGDEDQEDPEPDEEISAEESDVDVD